MQLLHSLVVLVPLLLGLLQIAGALPNPDFGVNANVSPAKTEVLLETSKIIVQFNDIGSASVTLDSGTPILGQMQMAIVSIGAKLQSSGLELMQRIRTLATNNGPSISDVFDPVYGAILSLQDLTLNGLTGEMTSITNVVQSSVAQKFNEVFADLRKALNELNSKLQILDRDVRKARTAAGNAPFISDTIVRNSIHAKTQSDVTRALIVLRLKVDTVRYMVRTTLNYLQDADLFMLDIMAELNGFENALSTSLSLFGTGMSELMQTILEYVNRSFGCVRAEQNAALGPFMSALSAVTNFSTTLEPPLQNLLTRLTPDFLESAEDAFVGQMSGYTQSVVGVSTSMEPFLRSATCLLLRKMVLTLISFGPQNEYCFNRFASHVYGLYELHHNLVSRCYEAELERLTTMAKFLRDAVDVLLHDVEDLADNVSVCVRISESRGSCVEQLGMLYSAVLDVFDAMLNDAIKLFSEEFATSSVRFGTCVSSSQHTTLNAIAKIDQRLGTCQPM